MSSNYEIELARHGKIVYKNVGTSMLPFIRQKKDLIIIKKRPEGRLKKYDAVLYKRDNIYILHRILKVRKNDYVICGDNRRILEYGITDEHIIGVLDAIVRDGKEILTTDRKYMFYVHLICDLFPIRYGVIFIRDCLSKIKRAL